MNPAKVERARVKQLTDLPNIGKAGEKDLILLGITAPEQLIGRSAYEMYDELCRKTGMRHDPCVIDVFLSITRFMDGDAPRPWWDYTDERKRHLK
ncbi:MAG TPA: helix-hairpin-helix domain-containing protein [Burkholderiaceae bacterium]